MSHRSVEAVIGKLVTDESFRRRFIADPAAALDDLRPRGLELTPVEMDALLALDVAIIGGLADAIDRRLQKADFAS